MINRCKWHLLSLALVAVVGFAAPPVAAETQGPVLLRIAKHKAGKGGFNWFANANPAASDAEAIARTKAAIANARGLSKGASWICSPSGSGRKATCYGG